MGFLDNIFDPGGDERDRASERLAGVRLPTAQDLELRLEELVSTGQLTPEEIPTFLQGRSAYEGITTDPRLRAAQFASLAGLQQISEGSGLDARARATLEEALDAQRTASRGDQLAILRNANARGVGGSGMETVSRMLASQGAATRGNRASLDAAALAMARRDNALRDQAGLAADVRAQEFGEQADVASNVDAIERYNALTRQDVAQRNVAARNVARASNLAESQRISDSNVDTRNANRRYNAELPLTLYGLQRGAAKDYAAGQYADAEAEGARNRLIGNTVMSAAGLLYGAPGGGSAATALGNLGASSAIGGAAGGFGGATAGSATGEALRRYKRPVSLY